MAVNAEQRQHRKRSLALRIVLYSGAVLGGLIALVLLINLYNPPLDADAAAALVPATTTVPDAENAYFVLYGVGVAEGQDPHAFGVRFVAANNEWVRSTDAGQPAERQNLDALEKLNETIPWQGETRELCGEQRVDCLSAYLRNRTQIDKLMRDNRVRLARYRSLYRYTRYRETMLIRFNSNWLPNLLSREHEVTLAEIALKSQDGNLQQSLQELNADTAYWRRVLAGTNTLLTKTIAASFLSRNYALASEIAARYRDRPSLFTPLSEMLRPMTQEERSWKAAFTGEYQFAANLFRTLKNHTGESGFLASDNQYWDRAFSLVLYKSNNTINLQYRWFAVSQGLIDSPANKLVENAHQLNEEYRKMADPFRVDRAYNPVGKILFAIGAVPPETYARYIARGHNLDASMRLLRLQRDIYSKKVSAKDIETYLEKSPLDLLDPYRNTPYRWDASKRELWFEGVDPKSKDTTTLGDKRVGVRLW